MLGRGEVFYLHRGQSVPWQIDSGSHRGASAEGGRGQVVIEGPRNGCFEERKLAGGEEARQEPIPATEA